MRYVGFNLEEERLEKLKVISLMTKKNRTELIKEGIDSIIEKYSDSFDKFQEYIKTLENK